MNKIELAKEIAGRMSLPVTMSIKFIDTICDVLGETIGKNESVLLQNFGLGNRVKEADGIHVPE